jgi:hypothetical protein
MFALAINLQFTISHHQPPDASRVGGVVGAESPAARPRATVIIAPYRSTGLRGLRRPMPSFGIASFSLQGPIVRGYRGRFTIYVSVGRRQAQIRLGAHVLDGSGMVLTNQSPGSTCSADGMGRIVLGKDLADSTRVPRTPAAACSSNLLVSLMPRVACGMGVTQAGRPFAGPPLVWRGPLVGEAGCDLQD